MLAESIGGVPSATMASNNPGSTLNRIRYCSQYFTGEIKKPRVHVHLPAAKKASKEQSWGSVSDGPAKGW